MLNVTAVSEKNQTKYSVQVRSILKNSTLHTYVL